MAIKHPGWMQPSCPEAVSSVWSGSKHWGEQEPQRTAAFTPYLGGPSGSIYVAGCCVMQDAGLDRSPLG